MEDECATHRETFQQQKVVTEQCLSEYSCEIDKLETILLGHVEQVILQLRSSHQEMIVAYNNRTAQFHQAMSDLQAALTTAQKLQVMVQDFHCVFSPKRLVQELRPTEPRIITPQHFE